MQGMTGDDQRLYKLDDLTFKQGCGHLEMNFNQSSEECSVRNLTLK